MEPRWDARVVVATLVGLVWVALPDHVDSRGRRNALRAVLLGLAIGPGLVPLWRVGRELSQEMSGLRDDVAEEEDDQDDEVDDDAPRNRPPAELPPGVEVRRVRPGVEVARIATSALARAAVEHAVTRMVVVELQRRGVRRPWTWVAVLRTAGMVTRHEVGRRHGAGALSPGGP